MKEWPKVGSKATFRGTSKWFFFQNILKDANDLLEIDKEYNISKIELASSWCGVVLKEFPNKRFSLNWFTYDKDLTTEEVMKIERDEWDAVKYEFMTLEELKNKKHICTFPDRSAIAVRILKESETQFLVQYTSRLGLTSSVWVSREWVS